MCIRDRYISLLQQLDFSELTQDQIDAICGAMSPLLTVTTGPDSDPDNATQSEDLDCGDTIHFHSPSGSLDIDVAAGSALVGLDINPAALTPDAKTVGIDCYTEPGELETKDENLGGHADGEPVQNHSVVWTNNEADPVVLTHLTVSYTHLTLPTIYSV